MPVENATDRLGDFRSGKAGRCNLVEQRLEKMMVLPIDNRNMGCPVAQMFTESQPAESRSQHDDMRPLCLHPLSLGPRRSQRKRSKVAVSTRWDPGITACSPSFYKLTLGTSVHL